MKLTARPLPSTAPIQMVSPGSAVRGQGLARLASISAAPAAKAAGVSRLWASIAIRAGSAT